jgi:hypothetical protein
LRKQLPTHLSGIASRRSTGRSRAEETSDVQRRANALMEVMRQGVAADRAVAAAQRSGATVVRSNGMFSPGSATERICATCNMKFVERNRVNRQERALGGALCRSCGNFYCEPCVARELLGGSGTQVMTCACGQSQVYLGDDGCAAMRNCEELVVFR